ncbi:MAG: hypothetical protein ABFD91_06340 [Anaerohalosphaeraceae bacterium]
MQTLFPHPDEAFRIEHYPLPASHEPHQGNLRKAFNGRGLVVIQSLRQKGTATLRAEAEGLAPCTITIKIK